MATRFNSRLKAGGAAALLACAFVGGFEGLRLNAYRDVVGVATVCYGETRGVKMSDRHTKDECDAKLIQGLQDFEQGVYRCTPSLQSAPNERVVALVSFAYNVGTGAYCKSTLARKFNAGDTKGACNELLKWNKAGGVTFPGLTRRRQAERELCLKGA